MRRAGGRGENSQGIDPLARPERGAPENNVCVLIKVADKFGNSAIYLGSREGNEYLTDGGFEFEIDCNDESSSEMKVIGWREMM